MGLGAWSDRFADCMELCAGLNGAAWPEQRPLQPAMIPPRERRRAPHTVKMALETMGQATADAAVPLDSISVVTASSMGDMDITDYMCKTLAKNPLLVSPTSFHNSVHNAAVGNWSISQSSHAACNAVAAGEYSGTAGLLEAAVLCMDSQSPVLLVIQEGKATPALMPQCRSPFPLSLALLLAAPDQACAEQTVATVEISLQDEPSSWPLLPAALAAAYSTSPAGRMLPLFIPLAQAAAANSSLSPYPSLRLPLSPHGSLGIRLGFAGDTQL